MTGKKYLLFIAIIFFLLLGFYFRFKGIKNNHPFWVDEFSTAVQARTLLDYGFSVLNNKDVLFEPHNVTTHSLVALFFKLLGQREWVARLPFVIIGSLVPLSLYLLARQFFDVKTALSAMLLSTFSYIEILWSRQARGYVLMQLLIVLSFYFYFKILAQKKPSRMLTFLFFLIVILGILTHFLFLISVWAILLHYLIFNWKKFMTFWKNPWFYFFSGIFLLIMFMTGALVSIIKFPFTSFFMPNNLWYYHSFLWREYGLVFFLGMFGLALAFTKERVKISLLLFFIFLHLVFLNFIFSPYHSRYLLPTFPFLFLGMAYIISYLSQPLLTKFSSAVPILITFIIILNGDTFVSKPKNYYSPNKDFREMANIDYHQVYTIIKRKYNVDKNIAIIETWPARTYWYIGMNFKPLYHFRWQDEEGLALGMSKKTNFFYNEEGEKMLTKDIGFVATLSDLMAVIRKYQSGFLFIDDSSLPRDVIDYAEKNLKRELYLDHYPLDENPYSIWPATLYSWETK